MSLDSGGRQNRTEDGEGTAGETCVRERASVSAFCAEVGLVPSIPFFANSILTTNTVTRPGSAPVPPAQFDSLLGRSMIRLAGIVTEN